MRKLNLLLVIVALLLFSCKEGAIKKVSNESSTKLGTYEKVIKDGKIRVGYIPYTPGFIEDPNTGELSGIFYDIDTLLAKRLNIEFEFVQKVNWGDIALDLNDNKVDIIASPIWPTIERAKFMEFSTPVYFESLNVFVRSDDNRFNGDLSKINNPKIKVGTIIGEISAIAKDRYFPNASSIDNSRDTHISQLLDDLVAKKVDVIFTSPIMAIKYLETGKVKEVEGVEPLNVYPTVMVMRKGDFALKSMIDNSIMELHNTGIINQIISKYEEYPNVFYRLQPPYAK